MNNTGKKYGGRKKGTPNKITTLVKENISKYITDCLNSIDIDSLDDSDKIRLALGIISYKANFSIHNKSSDSAMKNLVAQIFERGNIVDWICASDT